MERIPTITIEVRCYAELNDHLPQARRAKRFRLVLGGVEPTVAGAIDALAIPPEVIDVALVDGRSAAFGDALIDGAALALYPVFEAFDVRDLARLREAPLRRTRLLVDERLAPLAAALAERGLDVATCRRAELVVRARAEGQIILTRDRAVLADPRVTHGLHIAPDSAAAQLAAVLERLQL